MRLIDADALIDKLDIMISDAILNDTEIHYAIIRELVAGQPTIEAAPLQLAHWIPGKRGKWSCSCCGNEIYCTSADDLQRNHEFCGHCGAEMKDQCDMRTLIEEAIL